MSSVDNRIVQMKFDNARFEQGVSSTLGLLGKLKEGLKFTGASKGLTDIQSSASRFNLNGMETGIGRVSKSFLAMSTVGITALATVTSKAVDAGLRMVSAFTIDPIKDGFKGYQQQINATKTILSNVRQSGAGLKDVTQVLNQMQKYAQLTVYNFADMAKNVGTFTANGVGLKAAAGSIKGIANLAAMSGASSEDASRAMYQLSQAIGAGSVKLQDWNSVQNANLGTNTFKNALVETAVAMGSLSEKAVKFSGKMKNVTINGEQFRQSLTAKPGQTGWLTSKVLTNTLQQFTGDLTKAKLVAQGFTAQQAKAILATGKVALNAATQVKTWDQLTQALKEEVAGAYSKVFKVLFGNLPQATTLFSALHTTLENLLTGPILGFAKLLESWAKLGGRAKAIDAVKTAFSDLGKVLAPIKAAFREIFPPSTGQTLYNITVAVDKFMHTLSIGAKTSDNIKRTFAGLFAVLDIGKQIIGAALSAIGHLFGSVSKGSGGILAFTGNIGDFLVSLDHAIRSSGLLASVFNALGSILSIPIKLIGDFGKILSGISGSVNADMFRKIGDAISSIGSAIANMFNPQTTNMALTGLSAGLLGAIFLTIKKFIGRITSLFNGGLFGGGGMLNTIKDTFETLTNSLKTLQTEVQAKTLRLIGEAMALLALSMVALSFIDGKKLAKSLAAMTGAFVELLSAMAVLVKISGSAGFVKVPLIAASMVLLAGAVLLLTGAVALMGQLDWETIGRGLSGIAGVLVVIAGAMRVMPKNMVLQAAALVLIGVAVNAIGLAIAGLGQLDWETIGKGLVAIAGALLLIAGAMQLMPATLPITAAGLLLVSVAIQGIALAVAGLGQLGWEAIAKGLVALGGALLILAGGLTLMSGTLAGSAALLVAAGALAILTPVLVTLSMLSWEGIAKGLVALAGAFTVIGLAGLILTPIIPSLLGFGLAVGLLGGGLALAGAGALAFASAFTLAAAAGAAGVAVLGKMLQLFVKMIPDTIKAFGQGVVEFANVIAKGGAAFTRAITTILTSILDSIIKVIPKVGKLFTTLIDTALRVLVDAIPKIINAGMKLVLALLTGIDNHIGKIVSKGSDIIVKLLNGISSKIDDIVNAGVKLVVKFLNAISNQMPKITNAGVNLVLKFINSVTNALNAHSGQLGAAAGRLGVAIVSGMAKGILGAAGSVASAAISVAKNALGSVKNILGIKSPSRVFRDHVGRPIADGMAVGIWSHGWMVSNAAVGVAKNAKDAAQAKMPAAFEELGKLLNQGFVKGLVGSESDVRDALKKTGEDINKAVADAQANVLQDRDHLNQLLKAKNQDQKEVNKARAALAEAEAIQTRAQKAHQAWKNQLDDERLDLIKLSKQYDTLVEKIKAATQARDDAIAARDNANASITSQYSAPPDITDGMTVEEYTAALKDQADKNQLFLDGLNQLSKMGLDNATYQQFIDKGVGIQPFIDQLIAAGPSAVQAVNGASDQLASSAKALGATASKELYQAGVDAAQGLLDGLQSKEDAIVRKMRHIASLIEQTLKMKLKIKSPSRLMMEIGGYTAQGLADGISNGAMMVSDASSRLASTAIDSLKRSVAKISDTLDTNMDTNPVIAPVLDLTQLQKDAANIGGILNANSVTAGVSLNQASAISATTTASQTADAALANTNAAPAVIKFEQTNISPKALSAVEIYRQTRNQLSLAKEALTA